MKNCRSTNPARAEMDFYIQALLDACLGGGYLEQVFTHSSEPQWMKAMTVYSMSMNSPQCAFFLTLALATPLPHNSLLLNSLTASFNGAWGTSVHV